MEELEERLTGPQVAAAARARRGFIKGCAEHQADQGREKGERGVEERRGENSGHEQSARVRGEILGVRGQPRCWRFI